MLATLGRGDPRSDLDQQRLSIPAGEGTELLLEAGRRLEEAGIVLDDLGIRRPTLDEAFLALTGRTHEPDASRPSRSGVKR